MAPLEVASGTWLAGALPVSKNQDGAAVGGASAPGSRPGDDWPFLNSAFGECRVSLSRSNAGGCNCTLVQAGIFQGGFHPDSWVYTVNLSGPNDTSTITVRGESVSAFQIRRTEPERPWKGIGPLQAATAAARLDAETNTLMADISSWTPRKHCLPIPKNPDSEAVDAIVANLKKPWPGEFQCR